MQNRQHTFRLFVLLFLATFWIETSSAEFRSIGIKSETPLNIRLHFIEQNPKFRSIQYQAVRMKGDVPFPELTQTTGISEVDLLDVKFSALSPEQFAFLKQTYGGGRNRLRYVSKNEYRLSDFLPPFASVVFNKNFVAEMQIENNSIRVLMSNCWGTAYEFARSDDHSFDVFMTADWEKAVKELIDGGQWVVDRKQIDLNTAELQYVDTLLIFQKEALIHAAVYVDRGIWFEKTGSTSIMAYRFNNNLAADYKGSEYTYSVLRILQPAKIAEPRKAFVSKVFDCEKRSMVDANSLDRRTFPIHFRTGGVPFLNPRAYVRKLDFHLDPLFIDYFRQNPSKNPFDMVCEDLAGD